MGRTPFSPARSPRVTRDRPGGPPPIFVAVPDQPDVHSASPYGGYKMSDHGRETGFAVMDALTQEKSVWVSLR